MISKLLADEAQYLLLF